MLYFHTLQFCIVTCFLIAPLSLTHSLRKKGRVKIYDTVGGVTNRVPSSRALEHSPSLSSFSSHPQHTQGTYIYYIHNKKTFINFTNFTELSGIEDEADRSTNIGRDGTDGGRSILSSHPEPNIYYENRFASTTDDSEPATPSHVTEATPTTLPESNSDMEMRSLPRKTNPTSTSTVATLV